MPRINYKHSEETKRKIRKAHLGRKISEKARQKMSLAKLGKPSPRKGIRLSDELRKKLSLAHMGRRPTEETRIKMSISQTGRICWWKGKRGSEAANWQGGRVDQIKILRNSEEFKQWRIKVFQRDCHTCQECGSNKSNALQAHHIIPIRKDLTRIFDLNNGITLCQTCHGRTWWNEEKFEEKYFKIVNSKNLVLV